MSRRRQIYRTIINSDNKLKINKKLKKKPMRKKEIFRKTKTKKSQMHQMQLIRLPVLLNALEVLLNSQAPNNRNGV